MPNQLQTLEGNIFIHKRQEKQLHITHSLYHQACYFECFIRAKNIDHQNYIGHFIEVHCQPGDHIKCIYVKNEDQYKITALFNVSQQILHLHPLEKHIGLWTISHRYTLDLLQLFGFLTLLLFCLFSIATIFIGHFQVIDILLDSLKISLSLCSILIIAFMLLGLPVLYFKYQKTSKKLSLLGISNSQKLTMEKLNAQNGIYDFKKAI